MRDSENCDVQPAEQTEMLTDPDYVRAVEDFKTAYGHVHCTIYDVMGMCESCSAAYEKGLKLGAEDFKAGIALTDGHMAWIAMNNLPRVSGGAIEGYAHGWAKGSLGSSLNVARLEYEEVPCLS